MRQVYRSSDPTSRKNRVPTYRSYAQDSHAEVRNVEREKEKWYKPTSRVPSNTNVPNNCAGLTLIPWGGKISVDGESFSITNTCIFDNVVNIIYVMYKTIPQIHQFILDLRTCGDIAAKVIVNVFQELVVKNFKAAKTLIVTKLIKAFPRTKTRNVWQPTALETADFFASEDVVFDPIYELFEVIRIANCPNTACNNVAKGEVIIHPARDQDFQNY